MTHPTHRALRVVLRLFSALVAAGSLLLIFGGKSFLIRVFWHPPEAEVSTLFLFLARELGGLGLMLSLLLLFAARDPARNVAILDALVVGLCILAVTPLLSLYTLDVTRLYPASLVWGRSLVRLALAALLYYLRPRG
jgi:hypothetical protein